LYDYEEAKRMLKKVSKITEYEEMKHFILKHQTELMSIPTNQLNSYNTIKGYMFNRRNGVLGFFVRKKTQQTQLSNLRRE
jgi:hypothetical protein